MKRSSIHVPSIQFPKQISRYQLLEWNLTFIILFYYYYLINYIMIEYSFCFIERLNTTG